MIYRSLLPALISLMAISAADAQPPDLKTTAQHQRLTGEAIYFNTAGGPFQLADSAAFFYTGERGSSFDFENLMYRRDFYQNAAVPFVYYDKMYVYNPADLSQPADSTVNTYLASGDMGSQTNGSYFVSYSYNSLGQMASIEQLSFNTGTSVWDTVYRNYIFYNAAGKFSYDSSRHKYAGFWKNGSKSALAYNTAGLPAEQTEYTADISGNWQPALRNTISYNASGLPEVILRQEHAGGSWTPGFKDSIIYSGTNRVGAFLASWNGTSWNYWSEEWRNLNAAGLPDSIVRRTYSDFSGMWDTTTTLISYNSYNNPLVKTEYHTLNNSIDLTYYYYELYQTTGIDKTPLIEQPQVYPNPASSEIRVSSTVLNGQQVHWRITNLSGQVVMIGVHRGAGPLSVPAGSLLPGQYHISLSAPGYQAAAAFIKQ